MPNHLINPSKTDNESEKGEIILHFRFSKGVFIFIIAQQRFFVVCQTKGVPNRVIKMSQAFSNQAVWRTLYLANLQKSLLCYNENESILQKLTMKANSISLSLDLMVNNH